MNDWVVYLVICEKDGTLYTGITNNLEKRIEMHNKAKGAKYTKTRLPVSLLKSFCVDSKSIALKLEYKIKQMTRSQKDSLGNAEVAIIIADISTTKGKKTDGNKQG